MIPLCCYDGDQEEAAGSQVSKVRVKGTDRAGCPWGGSSGNEATGEGRGCLKLEKVGESLGERRRGERKAFG